MSCGCGKKSNGVPIYPDTYCSECVEKHLSIAMVLYFQPRYEELNKWFVQGQLGCAEFHCVKTQPELANEIAKMRKKLYSNEDIFYSDFEALKLRVDALK